MSMLEFFGPLLILVCSCIPLLPIFLHKVNRKSAKRRLLIQISVFAFTFLVVIVTQTQSILAETTETVGGVDGLALIAAALPTGLSTLGGGYAVAAAASSAIGALSENRDTFGQSMIFVALAEGIAIYGMLISILILNKI